MKNAVAELFTRFVAGFPHGAGAILRADQIQAGELPTPAKPPLHTVLVKGTQGGTEGPLAVVAMTVPSLSPEDPGLLEVVVRRARANKAPYFVTWTLRDAALWKTPRPGTPASRDSVEKLRHYPDLYEIAASDEQIVDEQIKLKVLDRGAAILGDFGRLLRDEALDLVEIDATYFVGRLIDATHRLLPMVSKSVHHRLTSDNDFRDQITGWALKQGIAGSPADPEFAESVSRQIIYRLLGKVLFYQSLRRTARQLPKLDLQDVDSSQVLKTLRTAFDLALKIDYHAVFEEDVPDRVQWPAEASRELASLIHDFQTRNFALLPQDVVGTVFERLIPPEERHGLGQYFTSENLCDLIVAFCIRSPGDTALDPTCGTGTVLIRAYDRLRWLGRTDHAALLSQLWGVDIAPFPAELATINLFRQEIAKHGNFPRIICRDFLEISPGDRFPFPPPKVDLEYPEVIEEAIPQFDAIVGNFPYVSASQIERYQADYLKFLCKSLINGWFESYPQLFRYKNQKEQENFQKAIAAGKHSDCNRDDLQHRLSTYADLYVHLFFHAARFLKPEGRMGIVTSNAWLDANFGYELQEFFLSHFKVVAVLESRCEPWFTEASVNTVVTIVERCDSPKQRDGNLVRFVKVKRPLAELIPGDPLREAPGRWQQLRKTAERIERAGIKYSKTHPLGMVTEEDDDFRVRILRQQEMQENLAQEAKTIKWGRFLRAPQIYYDISGHGKMRLLREIATPKFGSKTRINEFFHVTSKTTTEFAIEDEYLWPLIKSPKDSNTVNVAPENLKLRVFVCRRSKEELENLGHKGALNYIRWGESQEYTKGTFKGLPWPDGTWVKNREPGWWALPKTEINQGQVFFSEAFGDRHIHRFSPSPLIPDKRLYFLSPRKNYSASLLAAVLNSSVTSLSLEVCGRVTLGDGVLEFSVEDARDYLLVPDVRSTNKSTERQIADAFAKILERPIESVFREVQKADRQTLDSAVLKAIGLDPKKYLKPMYEGLCELVRERVELGNMRNKARKTQARGERAEKRTVEEVLDEILPKGRERFPDDFFSSAAAAGAKTAVELPEQPLIFEMSPMFMGVHVQGGSFDRHVKFPAEGKFLVYAQRAGHKVAYLPEKTHEITGTVANYEKYLRELRTRLYDAYYRRTLDTKTAARLTQAAFDRFHLPTPEG